MDDEDVSVDGDEEDREGGEEDGTGLGDTDQLAQDLLGQQVLDTAIKEYQTF